MPPRNWIRARRYLRSCSWTRARRRLRPWSRIPARPLRCDDRRFNSHTPCSGIQIPRRRVALTAQRSEIDHNFFLAAQLPLPFCFSLPGGRQCFLIDRILIGNNRRRGLLLRMKRHRVHSFRRLGLLFPLKVSKAIPFASNTARRRSFFRFFRRNSSGSIFTEWASSSMNDSRAK